MVWALRFDGLNDYCSIATPSSYHQSLTQYRWYCKLIRNNSDSLYIVGRTNNFESGIRVTDSSVRVRYGSSSVTFSGLSIPVSTNELEIEVQRDGNTHELFINNVSQGTLSSSATSTTTVNTIGRAASNYGDMDLILMELYDAPSGGSLISSYNATSSGHGVGTPVLVETVGGNNATGFNMPTDGSAWVNLGGGGISIPVIMNQLRNQGIN